MKRVDEHLYARVAVQGASLRRRYAVLDRGCWSEMAVFGGNVENNTQNFTGRIIDSNGVLSTESKKIGFFHPLYCGYAFKGVIVEVVPNLDRVHHDDDYLAIGQGVQTLAAWPFCLDTPPTDPCERQPCEVFECTNEVYAAEGWSFVGGGELGSENSTAIYDKLTMTHTMGPNEVPALLELYGFEGGPPTRPKEPKKPLLLSWAPNRSAFQYTFQICYRGGDLDRFSGPAPSGLDPPWWAGEGNDPCRDLDCCKLIAYYQETFGADWCQAIIDESELPPEEQAWWTKCLCFASILSWAQACCDGGEE